MIGVALFSLFSVSTPLAVDNIQVKDESSVITAIIGSRVFGQRASCRQAFLVPSSPTADAYFEGRLRDGQTTKLRPDEANRDDGALVRLLSDDPRARCRGLRAEFHNVSEGAYYIVVAVAATTSRTFGPGLISRPDASILVRQIDIVGGRPVRLEL